MTSILEIDVIYGKRRRHYKTWIGPDTLVSTTTDGRIIGKHRAALAEYLVRTAGNACVRQFPEYCIMGDRPFPHPEKADFDHLDGDRKNNRAGNFGLTCPPCNRHAQSVQWKSIRAAAATVREKERQATASVTPTDQRILDLSRGYETAGRSFIFQLLLDRHKAGDSLDPDEARVEMRNETGCSRATSYSIMERLLVGRKSVLLSGRDQVTGESGLRFRNSNCYNMSLEQLNAEYPARGNLSKKGVTLD